MTWLKAVYRKEQIYKLVLPTILILGSLLRFYGINWDKGFNFHPDERMIVMVAERLHWPKTDEETSMLLTPESPLNPKFFAYGSLPIYLLKIASVLAANLNEELARYAKMALVGRTLSVFLDLVTVYCIYLTGKYLKRPVAGLSGAFFYATAVLPIQLSHFYTVDTLLTTLVMTTLTLAVKFQAKPSIKEVLLLGITTGLAVSTKVSAAVLVVPVSWVIFFPVFKKPALLEQAVFRYLLIGLIALVVGIAVQPYAVVDYARFIGDIKSQSEMTKSAYHFPYTLQYVGKVPYLYELKNIFFWGLGPLVSLMALSGLIMGVKKSDIKTLLTVTALLLYGAIYFAVVGKFAIGFIRYMLPIYPLLCLSAGYAWWEIHKRNGSFSVILLALTLIYPLSFMKIYTVPTTHIQASRWIYKNVPANKVIAVEDWDYGLPVGGPIAYRSVQLPMYQYESAEKWDKMDTLLKEADYIVLASNRIYKPLMRLTDCTKIPQPHCFNLTAEYYTKLFNGSLGYKKVADFRVLPTIPLLNLQIDDSSADEAFSVYDHPQVMIFKNISYGKENSL